MLELLVLERPRKPPVDDDMTDEPRGGRDTMAVLVLLRGQMSGLARPGSGRWRYDLRERELALVSNEIEGGEGRCSEVRLLSSATEAGRTLLWLGEDVAGSVC